MGMKPSKSPWSHVLDSRNRLKCRTTLPFAFTGWYGPNQRHRYNCCGLEVHRKQLGTLLNDVVDLESTTFGSKTHGSLSFYLSKILKMDVNSLNGQEFTFRSLKIDWDVVRPFRLLSWLAMILNNIPDTLVVVWKATEKFLSPLEAVLLSWKTLLFTNFG